MLGSIKTEEHNESAESYFVSALINSAVICGRGDDVDKIKQICI